MRLECFVSRVLPLAQKGSRHHLNLVVLPVLLGARHLAWYIALPLTVLWVIGITNAFNLIDGLDGLAAGSALFSTFIVFVVAVSAL